jgi:uncharacterized SAM-binding protein YcdF (DUF218 family)
MVVLFALRFPILRGLGNALVYENDLERSEVLFVLSGSPYDRGSEAARLFGDGWAQRIVCTGGIVPPDFKALGLTYRESDLLRQRLLNLGIPDSLIEVLPEGTSTKEEADVILAYCRDKHIRSAMVVSSKFHTRRIKQVFRRKFKKAGIALCIRGAPSTLYQERAWWKSEQGLLTVNNEYVKMLWYLFN